MLTQIVSVPRPGIRCSALLCATLGLLNCAVAETSGEQLLVAPLALSELQQSSQDVRILDVRREDQFAEGHIPSAQWVDISTWYLKSFEPTGLTSQEYWNSQLASLGIDEQSTVVVVGGALPNSARAWWLCRYFGISDVRLLDGGMSRWAEAKLPVSTELIDVAPSNLKVKFQANLLATLKDVLPEARATTKCQILDNRSDGEFTGTRGIGARTGHIPTATQFQWQEFLDDAGCFLPPETISQRLADSGISLDRPIVAHCQTGGRSSVAAFALEYCGAKEVQNYYLGWSEYGEQLVAPVEK